MKITTLTHVMWALSAKYMNEVLTPWNITEHAPECTECAPEGTEHAPEYTQHALECTKSTPECTECAL